MVPAAGLEPARPAEDFGFKDRCVYHSAMRARPCLRLIVRCVKTRRAFNKMAETVEKVVDKAETLKVAPPDTGHGRLLDKFKQAARALETDDDPKRFKERVGKLVKHKPVEKSA